MDYYGKDINNITIVCGLIVDNVNILSFYPFFEWLIIIMYMILSRM